MIIFLLFYGIAAIWLPHAAPCWENNCFCVRLWRSCECLQCLHLSRFPLFDKLFLFIYLQITCTMVALWHHLRRARRSKFRRYGLLNNHIIPDATLCYHINCLFPVEDEQRLRTYNVLVIFCIRRHLIDFRVRVVQMSTIKRNSL